VTGYERSAYSVRGVLHGGPGESVLIGVNGEQAEVRVRLGGEIRRAAVDAGGLVRLTAPGPATTFEVDSVTREDDLA
jgi:hypothetical protein